MFLTREGFTDVTICNTKREDEMTRKDYILIAGALRSGSDTLLHPGTFWQGWMEAADAVADALQRENPRFDKGHFMSVVRGDKALTSRP